MEKYKSLAADPPWQYNNKRTGYNMSSGSSQMYPTLSLEEICVLPILNVMENNFVCFLWITVPLIDYGLEVLERWNCKYKTMIV